MSTNEHQLVVRYNYEQEWVEVEFDKNIMYSGHSIPLYIWEEIISRIGGVEFKYIHTVFDE